MHFQGKRDVYRSESKKPFRPLDEKTGLVCDNCGNKQKDEHRSVSDDVPVSAGMVTAKVTKGKTKTKKNVLAPKSSNVNKIKKETTMPKSCFCGCEQFSFKMNKEVVDNDPQHLYYNICSNCNHSLGSHIAVVRSKQAD
jgi:hypothetical protein